MQTPPAGKRFDELVVFDLDATLAHTLHRSHLSPFVNKDSDWPTYAKACVNDKPIAGAIALVNLLWRHYGIYILSGRDCAAYNETIWWLSRHEVMYDFLHLREEGDLEDNGIYKSKHIDSLKDDGYKVHLLIDDWPATIDSVTKSGTPALCVNPRYRDETMADYELSRQIDP